MADSEFDFDAPNVCENLLSKQDENRENTFDDYFLTHHDHEAKTTDEGSQRHQVHPPPGPAVIKHIVAVQGTGAKRSKIPSPAPINDDAVKKKQKVVSSNKRVTDASNDVSAILKMHNAKHKQKSQYEPPRHSVRDVRKWERKNLKVWSDLSHEEREMANSNPFLCR